MPTQERKARRRFAKARRRLTTGDVQSRPSDCLRSVQAPAPCPNCGAANVTIRHSPTRLAGLRCRVCCPCCAQAPRIAEREDARSSSG